MTISLPWCVVAPRTVGSIPGRPRRRRLTRSAQEIDPEAGFAAAAAAAGEGDEQGGAAAGGMLKDLMGSLPGIDEMSSFVEMIKCGGRRPGGGGGGAAADGPPRGPRAPADWSRAWTLT